MWDGQDFLIFFFCEVRLNITVGDHFKTTNIFHAVCLSQQVLRIPCYKFIVFTSVGYIGHPLYFRFMTLLGYYVFPFLGPHLVDKLSEYFF